MEPEKTELPAARAKIAESGRNPADFTFEHEYLPPDPDGGGMFTIYYEIRVANGKTGKKAKLIGGIGTGWLDQFEELVTEGYFD